jgi:hypothetical protein
MLLGCCHEQLMLLLRPLTLGLHTTGDCTAANSNTGQGLLDAGTKMACASLHNNTSARTSLCCHKQCVAPLHTVRLWCLSCRLLLPRLAAVAQHTCKQHSQCTHRPLRTCVSCGATCL